MTKSTKIPDGAGSRPMKYEDAVRVVQAMLRRWDPIGVSPGRRAPADEYDAYAPHIASMLAAGCNTDALAAHLEHLRTTAMGLRAHRDRDMEHAEALMAWWRAEDG